MRSGRGTPAGLSHFAVREKPTPLSMRISKENAEWMPFESKLQSFKVWKKDSVQGAFKPLTFDGL
jgi:hypothetical protein